MKPGTSVCLSVATVASSKAMSFFCFARSHIRPGCGKSPTSGGLPPATRARISVSHAAALVNLTVTPFELAHFCTSALKPGSVSAPRPYMISMVPLPAPAAVPSPLLPPEVPEDRHPDARPATATAARAVTLALRVIMVPNSSLEVIWGLHWPHAGRPLKAGRQRNRLRRWSACFEALGRLWLLLRCSPAHATPQGVICATGTPGFPML